MNKTPDFSSFVSPKSIPNAAPAPLHDIVGPIPFFPYTPLQLVIGSIFFLVVVGGMYWFLKKKKKTPPLSPREAALQALFKMKEKIMEGSDHQFGMLVSGLLRNYLSVALGLAAPRQTTEEFLETLRTNSSFTTAEQESLKVFLQQSDLLKFAGGHASEEGRLSLILAAERVVRGETKMNTQEEVG